MPNQPIKLPNVEYEMLIELAKKSRMKTDQYLIGVIRDNYSGKQ